MRRKGDNKRANKESMLHGKWQWLIQRFRINRELKDRMFILLFSNKERLLQLYNAINHSNYTDENALIITTIDNAVYFIYQIYIVRI